MSCLVKDDVLIFNLTDDGQLSITRCNFNQINEVAVKYGGKIISRQTDGADIFLSGTGDLVIAVNDIRKTKEQI